MVEFVYDSKYRVTIPCRRFLPVPEALGVVPFGDQSQANNDFPLVTELMYRIARRRAIQIQDNKLTLRTVRLTWAEQRFKAHTTSDCSTPDGFLGFIYPTVLATQLRHNQVSSFFSTLASRIGCQRRHGVQGYRYFVTVQKDVESPHKLSF